MPSKAPRESRDAALSKLAQKKEALEESRLRLLNEIECIDHSLKEIQAEYRKIVNEASPLLNLPTEVTCMIFELCVTSHDYEDPETEEQPFLPEIDISHVCKHWREVTLGYPRLWRKFFFRADNVQFICNSLDQFDAYIKRSGSQNLELFFDFLECRQPLRPVQQQQEQAVLLDMAIKHVERWKTVTLSHIPKNLDIEARLKLAFAPNLEYFVYFPASPSNIIYPAFHSRSVDISNPAIFKGGAPKLRYLLLECSNLTLPLLSNITTLRLERATDNETPKLFFTWNTFLDILLIPSLANLSLVETAFTVPEVDSVVSTINMNNLKHLRYSLDRFMTLLLPFIRAPLLQTLSIRLHSGMSQQILGPNPFGIPAESYFFPSLQNLILIDSTTSLPDSVWHLMQMTRNVTSILISHADPTDTFFDGLREHGAFNHECWPKLTSITANLAYWEEIVTISLFVRSRPKNIIKLRLFSETDRTCKTDFPDEYKDIQEHCTIEVLKAEEEAETALRQPLSLPGVDCPDYAFRGDPFEIGYW